MKNILAASALAATLLTGSAATSFAATMPVALNLDADGNASFSGSAAKNTSFTDYYTFSLTSATSAAASITASFSKLKNAVTSFTVSLFQGTVGNGTPVTGTSTTTTTTADGTTTIAAKFSSDDAYSFSAGNYYLAVSGKASANSGVSYGGSLSISAVPLPSTVALFGVALMGLGVAGAMRRKSASSAA